MGGFWTDILKCSEGEGDHFFDFFFPRDIRNKRFARSKIFRYRLPKDILSKRHRKRKGGAHPDPDPTLEKRPDPQPN